MHFQTLTCSGGRGLITKKKKGRLETEGRSIPAPVVMEISQALWKAGPPGLPVTGSDMQTSLYNPQPNSLHIRVTASVPKGE